MGQLRRDYQLSVYEVCLGIENRISKEMDILVGHVRRLIDQNAFLYDRVVELEKRDDTEKVSSRTGNLNNTAERQVHPNAHNTETLDEVRRCIPGRRISGSYRQAG
jgi:hypothetical protein